jgi:hypothetical protein
MMRGKEGGIEIRKEKKRTKEKKKEKNQIKTKKQFFF